MARFRSRFAPAPKPLSAFPASVREEVKALRKERAALEALERRYRRALVSDGRSPSHLSPFKTRWPNAKRRSRGCHP